MFGFSFSACQSPQFHIEAQFDAVMPFKQGIAAARKGERWGFIDSSGAWVLAPKFVKAALVEEKIYQVRDESNQVFEIKKNAENAVWTAVPAQEKTIRVETNLGGRHIFEKDGYWGIRDDQGKILAAPVFDSILYLGSNLFRVQSSPRGYCLLDANGKERTAYVQEISPAIQYGKIRFRNEDRYGLLDLEGKIHLPATWWRLEIVGQCIACSNGGRLHLCNNQLEKLTDYQFDEVIYLDEKHWLAKITDTGQARIFNLGGKVVKPEVMLSDGKMVFGRLPVQNPGTQKWGYINSQGETIIPFTFSFAESFWSNGKAIFWGPDQMGGVKKGLIDTTGKILHPPVFDEIQWHPDGVYSVIEGKNFQLLDEKLNPLCEKTKKPLEYLGQGVYALYVVKKSLRYQKSNWYTGTKGGFYQSRDFKVSAVYSLDGHLLLDGKEFEEKEPLPVVSEGFAAAKKLGKWGFVKCGALD